MNIFITGGTGFIGRQAVTSLYGKGHSITAWVRDTTRAKNLLGDGIRVIGPVLEDTNLQLELENADVVINLAGKPIAGTRWTRKNKKEIRDSRINITKRLANTITKCKTPPSVFISASAVGFYGNNSHDILTEDLNKGSGYLSDICEEWEKAALEASLPETRICLLRTGLVLGREGGFLQSVAPLFEMGIGIYIGSNPYIPWIHLSDMVRIIEFCIENSAIAGAVNCTSPKPQRAREFGIAMNNITNAKLLLSVPPLFIRIILGEAATTLTSGQYTSSAKIEQFGFNFEYSELSEALDEELSYKYASIKNYNIKKIDPNQVPITEAHNIKNVGEYELVSEVRVQSDTATVFSFFSSPLNLGLLTPSWMNFQILSIPDSISTGSKITYRIGLWLLGFNWLTNIVIWKPNEMFVDLQEKGPYTLWWHEHMVKQIGDGSVLIRDRVIYSIPLGILGRFMHRLFIKKTLLRVFNFRRRVILARFNQ